VALLCADGKPEAAIQLEELWNGLAKRHTFSLLCAYPMNLFATAEHAEAFRHVCAMHTRVRPAESFRASDDAQELAMTVAALQQKAMALQTEVAKRTSAEQTLRRRERELSDFLENAAEGLHRVAGDGTILWANRAELDMLGYADEEYIGHHVSEFYVDQRLIEDVLRRLRAGETLHDQPVTLRCKDGGRRYVQITSNAYLENGKLVYTRCFTRDVTDRRLRETAERERNNLLMQAPVAAALLTGPEHTFRLANPLYCQMVGRHNLVGKPYLAAFPELANTGLPQVLDRVFLSGEPYIANEYCVWLDRQGTGNLDECFFKFNFEPLKAPDGVVYGMMAVAIDISELVRGRRALERSDAERSKLLNDLREASQAKDEFLAMLGHELRNPLSPIVTALQLMKMRGDLDSTKEQGIIQRQVDHLIRLVDDLLDVSRITRGKVELRNETTELAQVLARAVEIASMLFEQRRHRLTIEVAATGLMWCGDATRLAQVVANLLTNAARYTDPGGDIRLRAARECDQIVIGVRDNGRGLSTELRSRVFELFFQGHRGPDREGGGLGVGLALVKNLVELHGGTVEAHSDGPGQGSEFIVRLPMNRLEQAVSIDEHSKQAAKEGSSAKRRVLVVDDNSDAADLISTLLRSSGHSVVVAHDPAQALLALKDFEPDVALLDIGLPVMDGYELAAELRQRLKRRCHLIALTGYGQEADRRRSAAAGFDGHLVKPVDGYTLLREIDDCTSANLH
jgi:PAS domain S-box-containing protein